MHMRTQKNVKNMKNSNIYKYTNANILNRKFGKCSHEVKVRLF